MSFLVFGVALQYVFGILLTVTATFLILLILVQKGRGGGLTGALGGMGGQSAFGTKAGDMFTRITMVVAVIWILLSVGAIAALNKSRGTKFGPAAPGRTGGGPAIESEGKETGEGAKERAKEDAKGSGSTEASPGEQPVESKGPVEKADSSTPPATPDSGPQPDTGQAPGSDAPPAPASVPKTE